MDNSDGFYKQILENLYDGVYFVDRDRKITFWNKGAERITGFTAEQVLGSHCYDQILNHIGSDGFELCKNGCPVQATITDGSERTAEVYLHHRDGYRVPVFIRTVPIHDDKGVIGCVEIFSNNTERLEALTQIRYLESIALTDRLSGIPNRRYIENFVQSKQDEYLKLGISYGVLFVDLDDFKHINDAYGHQYGDLVIKAVSSSILNVLRKTDMVGRWGGEEFVVALAGINEEQLIAMGEKIRHIIENTSVPSRDGEIISVTASVGVALARDYDDMESLILRADQKMYESKKQGKNMVTH